MKMSIIFVSLFSLSLSLEMTSIDLGKNVIIDSSNYEFRLAYKGPSKNMFLFLVSHEKGNLGFEIECPMIEFSTNLTKKENGIIIYNQEGACNLKFRVEKGDGGSLIVYDFKALYEIGLKNIYGKIDKDMKWDTIVDDESHDESKSKLTFLVPNFRTNSNITFEYLERTSFYSFKNPFMVCHEKICKENVSSYYFEKGKSYQIYVKVQKVSLFYAIPPFKFYAEDSEEKYSNDDIKYTYNEPQPGPNPPLSSNYIKVPIQILILLISLLL